MNCTFENGKKRIKAVFNQETGKYEIQVRERTLGENYDFTVQAATYEAACREFQEQIEIALEN